MSTAIEGLDMAKKRNKRRTPVKPDDRSGPTPETKAKLRPDPFNVLVERGLLDTAQRDAGLEIAAIYAAVTSFNRIKCSGMGESRGYREMSDELAEAHAQVYLPWCAHWGRRVEHVIDLVYDRQMPHEIALSLATASAHGRDPMPDDTGSVGRMLTDYAHRVRAFRKIRRAA